MGTFVPLHRNRFWLIRTQSNIKAYYLILNLVLIVLLLSQNVLTIFDFVLLALLSMGLIFCLKVIWPYTVLAPKSVEDSTSKNSDRHLNILIYNVLQKNEKHQKFVDLVREVDPDIFLMIEVDDKWYTSVRPLEADYPHVIKELRDNTYGIAMMSRIPYISAEVKHIVKEDVPSLDVLIEYEDKKIRITSLHPEPPMPGEVLTSAPKDLELLKTAYYLRDNKLSDLDIVIGDLNDVGWSKNSNNFKEISGLKDPREGRGFYSTFPTYLPIRIPIDHVFCSSELKLVSFKTLKNIGSDHFPVSVIFEVGE